MTTQYENLATLDLWTDFFKVTPLELPERQMRGRRMSGFIRGTAEVLPETATTESNDVAAPAAEDVSPSKKTAPRVINSARMRCPPG